MAEPADPVAPLHIRLGRAIKRRWRAWLRAVHRDVGYLAIGLTVIYAVSGIAINHIDDWNPNFKASEETHQLALPLPTEEEPAMREVLRQLGISEEPNDFYLATDTQLEIELPGANHAIHVDLDTGKAFEEVEEPRFFLRVANWLHYNRGKAAWTYIADGYAVFLLFLAISGLFMLKGRKGLIGRGAVLVLLGASVPILYIHFSGGP
ncbi:MAG TPA: PepSY-associated TM helix domain-containing protein [Kofleriaceae bacterium]|nr:PepSY-associated TM helix domain-containing protein [Kofleriaceae bacterium]